MTDWSWIDFDLPAATGELRSLLPRVAELVSGITAAEAKCSTLEWTRAQTAAHIIVGLEAYRRYVVGEEEQGMEVERLAESQLELITARVAERDPDALAARLVAAGDEFVQSLKNRDPYEVIALHGGRTQPLGAAAGLMIGELLLHGWDLARDAKREWPIGDDPSRHIARANFAILSHFINFEAARRHPRVYSLRVEGVAPARFAFSADGLQIDPWTGGSATCHVALRPAAWPLVLYGRQTALSQVLRRRAIAWGRNPLAAFALRGYAHAEI